MNRSWPLVVLLAALCSLNLLVFRLDSFLHDSDEWAGITFGVFTGECFLIAVWIAWGPDSIVRRLLGGFLAGALLLTLGIVCSNGEWLLRDQAYWLVCLPLVALCSTAGVLLVFRAVFNWQVYRVSDSVGRDRSFTLWQTMAAVTVCCCIMAVLQFVLWNRSGEQVFLTGVFAASLSTLVLSTCPLIVWGVLAVKIRVWCLVLACVLAIVHGIAIAVACIAYFPLPGAGGMAGYVGDLTISLALTASAIVAMGAWVCRASGYRLHIGSMLKTR